jgi:biotin carboxylase
MKKVLIINAGSKQLPMVRWAKKKGYFVLVADSRKNMLCFPEADKVLPIAPFEREELIEAAVREGIDAVCYTTSENPIPVVRAIADRLGLPHALPDKAALASCSKIAMREMFAEAGINDIPFARVRSLQEVEAFGREAGFPLVLKLTGSGNQIGMFILSSPEEFAMRREEVGRAVAGAEYLAERLYEGTEVNAIGLYVGGRLVRHTVSDRLHYGPAYNFVVYEHRYPSTEPRAVQNRVRDKLEATGRALDVVNGILFVQYIVSEGEPRTIELGARVPGGMMWQLFRWATGVDLMETWLDMFVKRDFSITDVTERDSYGGVSIRFLSGPPGPLPAGRLLGVDGMAAARGLDGVRYADFYNKFKQVEPPKAVPTLRDGSDRFFCCITTGDTYEAALVLNHKAETMLRFVVEADNTGA